MIRLTRLTREIINFIEENEFATVNQIANICFKGTKYASESARRRLKQLVDSNILTTFTTPYTGKELLYCIKGNKKTISYHRYMLQNFYSMVYNFADEVLYWKKEENWALAKRKSDGHIIFKYNGEIYSYLVEVDINHPTDKDKYNQLYSLNEVQEWYKDKYDQDDFFPDIVIINVLGNNKLDKNDNYSVVSLDYSLNNIQMKLTAL